MRRSLPTLVLLAVLAALAAAPPAHAQFVPLQDLRRLSTTVHYAGLDDGDLQSSPAPFAYWNGFSATEIDNPDPNESGYCQSSSWQISQIVGQGISASGGGGGNWYEPSLGALYSELSRAQFVIRLPGTMAVSLDVWVQQGTAGAAYFALRHAASQLNEYRCDDGELHLQFRLAPGDYDIDGSSAFTSTDESTDGGVYTYLLTFSPVPSPLIVGQPRDTSILCGASPHFTVATSIPAASLTFQWRRNGVPLVDGPRVSGSSTPTLTLPGACFADTGWYDVIVGNGPVTEPSRRVHLGTGTTEDVPLATSPPGVRLELAGPNPSAAGAALRYAVERPGRVTVAVFDVAGARVRTLLDREVQGPGLTVWDGRDEAGARAPAGLYFVRLASSTGAAHRTVVLLN